MRDIPLSCYASRLLDRNGAMLVRCIHLTACACVIQSEVSNQDLYILEADPRKLLLIVECSQRITYSLLEIRGKEIFVHSLRTISYRFKSDMPVLVHSNTIPRHIEDRIHGEYSPGDMYGSCFVSSLLSIFLASLGCILLRHGRKCTDPIRSLVNGGCHYFASLEAILLFGCPLQFSTGRCLGWSQEVAGTAIGCILQSSTGCCLTWRSECGWMAKSPDLGPGPRTRRPDYKHETSLVVLMRIWLTHLGTNFRAEQWLTSKEPSSSLPGQGSLSV
jgi:hypothetical protein